jgi:transcription elongation GreA/GreB family factor
MILGMLSTSALKAQILDELKNAQRAEIDQLKEAYETSHKHATESELKAEGKYDTRSIEAGYLAGAQKRRIEEAELDLALLDEIDLAHTSENVAVGSLIELAHNNINRTYFISSTAGGRMLSIGGQVIMVISAFSPLGSEAIGLSAGDEFELITQGDNRLYTIERIL